LLLSLGQPSLVWVWVGKFSPKNPKFFSFCPAGQKNVIGLGLLNTELKTKNGKCQALKLNAELVTNTPSSWDKNSKLKPKPPSLG